MNDIAFCIFYFVKRNFNLFLFRTFYSFDAWDTLAKVSGSTGTDLIKSTLLETVYNSYKNLDTSAYTPETRAAFQTALAEADRVMKDTNATESQIKTAANKLLAAAAGLKTNTTALDFLLF